MSSQLVTMPLLIGYAVSSMSRAAVHSSPIMISCVRKRYRSQHTAAACTRHAAIPARTFSCTFWIFSSERRMGRPTIEGKMCAGKLSPAKPHFTNCENSSPWSRGGYSVQGLSARPRGRARSCLSALWLSALSLCVSGSALWRLGGVTETVYLDARPRGAIRLRLN